MGKSWATLQKGWEVPDNQKSFLTQPSFYLHRGSNAGGDNAETFGRSDK
ncbi:hypothetical protein [uncultured Duncaniella sp.]|nr:hypothetical protein [uncultured Duncaniella sp.]